MSPARGRGFDFGAMSRSQHLAIDRSIEQERAYPEAWFLPIGCSAEDFVPGPMPITGRRLDSIRERAHGREPDCLWDDDSVYAGLERTSATFARRDFAKQAEAVPEPVRVHEPEPAPEPVAMEDPWGVEDWRGPEGGVAPTPRPAPEAPPAPRPAQRRPRKPAPAYVRRRIAAGGWNADARRRPGT